MHPIMPRRIPLLLLAASLTASAKPGTEKVADGFERPLWVGAPPESHDCLWVLEQAGRISRIDTRTHAKSPVLDICPDVSRKGNEEGLLGLAFAPDFARSGRFYVNYVDRTKFTRIVRFTFANDHADPASGETILQFKQPYENHNGGWLTFGPDGFLYIATGDGGAGNDPQNHAQSLDTFLGKLLRIDVSAPKGYTIPAGNPFASRPGAKPEIWAYGLRNPWRCSFDRKSGDLWIGDVGQNNWEEIDWLPHSAPAGANFGWRLREGDKPTPAKGVGGNAPAGAVEPVYVYNHGGAPDQGMSVTGGYLYHGSVPELAGRYVFGDYQNPRIWSFTLDHGKAAGFRDHTEELQPANGRILLIPSFGEDNNGDLYIVDHTGPIYKIINR